MKNLKNIFILFCFSFSVAAIAQTNVDPLKSFEKIIQKCQSAFNNRSIEDVYYVPQSKVWVKRLRKSPILNYDVKKTDSLVSPYIATLEFTDNLYTAKATNEVDARALIINVNNASQVRFEDQATYAMQGGNWILKSWTSAYSSKDPQDTNFTFHFKTDFDLINLQKENSPSSNCFP
jgi:hypothetical protein